MPSCPVLLSDERFGTIYGLIEKWLTSTISLTKVRHVGSGLMYGKPKGPDEVGP